MTEAPYRIKTIGWDNLLIENLLERVQLSGNLRYSHLVLTRNEADDLLRAGVGASVQVLRPQFRERLPEPDTELLASLEGPGIPTIHNMILGDRVLCTLPAERALAYLTFLAHRIMALLKEDPPEIVVGGFDSAHAGIGLAVCRKLGIPWVAMAFTTIPRGLLGFSSQISPDGLLPLTRPVDAALMAEAERILDVFLGNKGKTHAYVSAHSLSEVFRRAGTQTANLWRRYQMTWSGRMDEFTWPTNRRRMADYIRRAWNTALLPTVKLMHEPPLHRFAFYPLHMQPESSIDNWEPFYADQLTLVRQMVRALPPDLPLLIKLHISDADNYSPRQLNELRALPGVRLVHPTARARAFLEKADLVFGIQGTASLEAAMLGRPVLMFGQSPYLRFPGVKKVVAIPELPREIHAALHQEPPPRADIVNALAAFLARYMPGLFNDWSKPIGDDDVARVAAGFERLGAFVRAGGYQGQLQPR